MDFGTIMFVLVSVWVFSLALVLLTGLGIEGVFGKIVRKNKYVFRGYLIYCMVISLIVLIPVALLEGGIRSIRSCYFDLKSELKREWHR